MPRSKWMYLAYITQFLVFLNVLYTITRGAWSELPTALGLFIISLLPYLFTWKTKITFPWFVYFLISLAFLIHLSGYVRGRYLDFVNWDVLAHTVSGSMLALVGFIAILFIDRMWKLNLNAKFMAIVVLLIGLAGEYCWEIFEFIIDQTIGGSLAGPMQADNTDTMMDMIFVLIPSVIIAIASWYYISKNGKEKIMEDMMKESTYKI
ncbi:MAG: hypothetical protein LUO91_01095 [Methanomicrobiales archaeon]|nr:hypothetical protein [Methanomicrobiales archaeon]